MREEVAPEPGGDRLQAVREGFETYNRDGVRATAEKHWHPDVEWQLEQVAVAAGGQARFRGRDEAIAMFGELESIMGKFTAEMLSGADGPAGVVAEVRLHAQGQESGVAVDQRYWYAIEFEDELERRIQVFDNRADALNAVGMSEREARFVPMA